MKKRFERFKKQIINFFFEEEKYPHNQYYASNYNKKDILDLSSNGLKKIPDFVFSKNYNSIKVLALHNNQIKEIPAEIAQLKNLVEITLFNNQIKEIPTEIGKLSRLKKLSLFNNRIKEIPPEIGKLSQLSDLILSNNYIKKIPTEIKNLKQLKKLVLHTNRIQTLPVEVTQLNKLESLIIFNNKIKELPTEIKNLIQLQDLIVFNNNLLAIPSTIGYLTKLRSLALYHNEIEEIPKEIGKLILLKNLGLDNNKLKNLPNEIGQLTKLYELTLFNNQIQDIPSEIGRLKKLEKFCIQNNRIGTVPPEIGQLTKLRELRLNKNALTEFTVELCQLMNLHILALHDNKIKVIPKEISNLNQLKNLWLHRNEIQKIPKEIGQLKQLTILGLHGNTIEKIPPEIGNLTQLIALGLSDNKITSIPSEIGRLNQLNDFRLHNNRITEIPPDISSLNKVSKWKYVISGNPIHFPPKEVVAGGISAVRNFYEELNLGVSRLYEAKLIVVGEPGAGKTTLCKKLIDPNSVLTKDEPSTEGIDIIPFRFDLPKNKRFLLNIWDFGGQEIYYYTHQFFLTERSLYVLVADERKEDANFNYWLNTIELYSKESPVLIIQNEKQDRKRKINERAIRARYKNIKGFWQTNLATNRGLETVKKVVELYAQELPHIGTELPKPWVLIRSKLEKLESNYIDIHQYLSICKSYGITTMERTLWLSRYLHDLGAILHFQDVPSLKSTIILNNEWVTNAVYRLLDSSVILNSSGKFSFDEFKEILFDTQYENKHFELLELLQQFKICYEIGHTKNFIVPERLPASAPTYQLSNGPSQQLKYSYEFMPRGIITRLIVEMNHYIIDHQQQVWKSGVFLHKNDSTAEIIEIYGQNEIFVKVVGSQRKSLWVEIMAQLDKINASFPELKFEKLIPCNCTRCKIDADPYFFRESDLHIFIKNNRFTFPCKKPNFYDANIAELLVDIPNSQDSLKSNSIQNTIVLKQTRKLISSGQTNLAIQSLGEFLDFTDFPKEFEDEFIHLSGRYHQCEKNRALGIFSGNDLSTEINQINHSLIQFIRGLEDFLT